MSDTSPSGREYGRTAFVLGCVLAVVLVGLLLPVLTTPFGVAPIETALPTGDSDGGGIGAGGGLGALNPGDSTDVGGDRGGNPNPLRSQSAEIHFVVESTEAAYWRTGGYDTYTGSGWDRSGESLAYDGQIQTDGLVDRTVSYRVELNRSATALPTVWRPRTVDTDAPVSVTQQRAVTTETALDAGTTYTATSARPPRDPATLAAAGRDYPAEIADQYTQLPDSTPGRLERFTDDLTADADSPYETATAIEGWLETNKSYSLNVSGPGGDSVASDFVFEMDEGYCEYFATSMVAMLRTQDVPARYVVGYSTGQRTGENTYAVRGMNAHAWVEVYFPDVGWVRFDPTPGGERLAAEQDALQRQRPDAEYDHDEEGSPGETFEPEETPEDPPAPDTPDDTTTPADPQTPETPGDTTTPEESDDGSTAPVTVSLSERPVPGSTVTVTVTRDGSPVSGVTVLFNGESIGETLRNGTVDGRVPYAEQLNVTVQAQDPGAIEAVAPPPGGDRRYALRSPSFAQAENVTGGERTYDVPTNATLALSGTVATGQTVTLTATVAGSAIPNATVGLDGQPVGTTDGDGRLELTLPAEPGSVALTAQRGAVTGNRTLDLAALELDVDPQLPVALPWSGVTVTAKLGNETLADVPVSMGGEAVGRTDVDGTLTISLPLSDGARLSVAAYEQRATATVDGLWRNLAAGAGVATALLLGVVVSLRRYDVRLGAVLDRLVDAILAVPGWALGALVATADALVGVGVWVVGSLRRGLAALRAYLSKDLSLDALIAAFRAWLEATATEARSAVEPLRPTAGANEPDEDDPSAARLTIRNAWGRFLGRVSVRDPATMTPGELAAHAVERDDLPADAVATLRDAFRAVEYGARSPEDRLGAVQSAIEALDREDEE
ncbi:MAG: transglutaminase domain-containing protein [Halapricum sp.]